VRTRSTTPWSRVEPPGSLLPAVGKFRGYDVTDAGPVGTAVAAGIVEATRRWIVLSSHERRIWLEMERTYGAMDDVVDPVGRKPGRRSPRDARGNAGVTALAVGGICIAIMFAVVGAPVAGLVVAGGTALVWLVGRYWRQVGRACETACLPIAGTSDDRSPEGRRRTPEATRSE
jgi:hypothetical protein